MKGHHTHTRRIFFMNDLFQTTSQLERTLNGRIELCTLITALCLQQDFIHIPPENHRRMMLMLTNHLTQLTLAVFGKGFALGHHIHNRYLFPYQHTFAIAHFQ